MLMRRVPAVAVAASLQKVGRFPAGYEPGPARLYNGLLSERSIASEGPVIRASFAQAGPGTRTEIARSEYVMWTGDLRIAR